MPAHAVIRSAIVCSLVVAAIPAAAENWPNWRGPTGLGVSSESNLPLTWSTTDNVRWKVKLPERGNSTPVIWGQQIFLTQPLEADHKRTLMCLDRTSGDVLWQAATEYDADEPTHRTNPYCSASPVTDGERVIAWYGSAGVYCYDLEGKELWHADLGLQEHEWGYAASPLIFGDLCFLNFGPGTNEFVVALDKRSGREVWRRDIPPATPEALTRDEGLRGSWSTPLVIQSAGHDELILTLPEQVVALAPQSGRELWTCDGLGSLVYTSPIWGDDVLVSFGGYHRASLAIKAGGAGDVTSSHRLWHEPNSKRLRLGSGIIHKGHIYTNDMQGIVQCLDLGTGDVVWEKRLGGDTWSSLVMTADERLYMLNQEGTTYVVRANPKYELLATNPLDEATNASIVVSDGQLFIRTHEHLWCIGTSE